MRTCDICDKVSGEVQFDSVRGKYLCLTCKFGSGEYHTERVRKESPQQPEQSQPTHAAYVQQVRDERGEQREHARVPVLVTLDVMVGGVRSQIFYPANIENFSPGGICIDWQHCSECSGYNEGAIHPFCIFAQFSLINPASRELTIRVEMANMDSLEFQGKVAYVLKKKDKEFVGITFTVISAEVLASLEKLCAGL
ncbi:PilZ domain-containing protein [Planctomycetota bacterium]